MFPYMKQQNWLYNYQFKWGIANSLAGVVRRSAYLTESDTAYALFEENYHYLQQCYNEFFPLLRKICKSAISATMIVGTTFIFAIITN